MHKETRFYSGLKLIALILCIAGIVIPSAIAAETVVEDIADLPNTTQTSSPTQAIQGEDLTTVTTNGSVPDTQPLDFSAPPQIVLMPARVMDLTSTILGTTIPGSVNATITSIQWDWGDNTTTEQHEFPHSHTYRSPGSYTLTITAFQSDGLNTTRATTITIDEPVAIPTRDPLIISIPGIPTNQPGPANGPALTLLEPVIDGMNVTVNGNLNAGSPGVTISSVRIDWDEGNVTNVTDLPATYRYAAAGIYTITITAAQSDGQTISKGITVDITAENPGPPGLPAVSTPPPYGQPLYLIILTTAVIVILALVIGQRLFQKRREDPRAADIPEAVSLQEKIYYEAKGKGDLTTAAASAHICAQMFRALAEKSPEKRGLYLDLAEKWETIAATTGKTGAPEPHPQKSGTVAEKIPSRRELEAICDGTDVSPEVVESVIQVAMEIGREGREGQAVGTSFVVGDTDAVMTNSRQFVLNPFQGHNEAERQITESGIKGNIKEFAQLDGAFIISGDGIVESAGRYITVDMSQVKVPDGLGSRHSSIAGITLVTSSIGIVVSQSGGLITIFKNGTIVHTIGS
ncbi:MAG TPA: diadenylate cyclase [Methanoregulaceae archaeon]|nr:diadenylate cyclase [Methanoregulaceae archaeon]HOH81355.1 diadenylate cyclase [Methanoregulaceae archaeon]HPW10661.1 diadenylate cyclase [Methanoregulaceae archaeon]HQM56357.1 diadenylate cyclase [Methanoregulaceae archaeon]